MSKLKKALIFFAKSPHPGYVKTRLQPSLSPKSAARIYRAFVLDCIRTLSPLQDVTRMVACDPSQNDLFFQDLARKEGVCLIDQRGRNLGERMKNAIQIANRMDFGKVVIVGTDSPTLPTDLVAEAFKRLDRNRLVLGPSQDGGYYLIGCRSVIPSLFQSIPWGSHRVLGVTLKKVIRHRIRCALLPFWYDVDTIEDLHFMKMHLDFLIQSGRKKIAPETASVLKNLRIRRT